MSKPELHLLRKSRLLRTVYFQIFSCSWHHYFPYKILNKILYSGGLSRRWGGHEWFLQGDNTFEPLLREKLSHACLEGGLQGQEYASLMVSVTGFTLQSKIKNYYLPRHFKVERELNC